jgi:hypothetical protein
MTMNTQSPFDPFRVDLPREEGSWLVDREAIRPKRCKGLGRDGLRLWFRYRRLVGAVIVAAVAGGAAGFGYLWFAMP